MVKSEIAKKMRDANICIIVLRGNANMVYLIHLLITLMN